MGPQNSRTLSKLFLPFPNPSRRPALPRSLSLLCLPLRGRAALPRLYGRKIMTGDGLIWDTWPFSPLRVNPSVLPHLFELLTSLPPLPHPPHFAPYAHSLYLPSPLPRPALVCGVFCWLPDAVDNSSLQCSPYLLKTSFVSSYKRQDLQ